MTTEIKEESSRSQFARDVVRSSLGLLQGKAKLEETADVPYQKSKTTVEEVKPKLGQQQSSEKIHVGLTQKELFNAVFAALLASIFICFLVYSNYILLGEFFFVTIIAGIKSFYLRRVKARVQRIIENAFKTSFYFSRMSELNTYIIRPLFTLIKEKSFTKMFERIT